MDPALQYSKEKHILLNICQVGTYLQNLYRVSHIEMDKELALTGIRIDNFMYIMCSINA